MIHFRQSLPHTAKSSGCSRISSAMPSNTAHLTENRPLIFPHGRRENIGLFQFKITVSDSRKNMRILFLLPSSAYTAANIPGPALALQSAGELSKTTLDGFGQNRALVRDRPSISLCRAIFRLRINWPTLD